MRALIGLGNPGGAYQNTRHNVGFMVLDLLAQKLGVNFTRKDKFKSWLAKGTLASGVSFLLIKPATFMNLSGIAVKRVMDYFNLCPEDVLVILDDVSLNVGELRLRESGSAGGHNGLESVLQEASDIARLRVGIGNEKEITEDLSAFVLKPFENSELEIVQNKFNFVNDILDCFLEDGFTKTKKYMNDTLSRRMED